MVLGDVALICASALVPRYFPRSGICSGWRSRCRSAGHFTGPALCVSALLDECRGRRAIRRQSRKVAREHQSTQTSPLHGTVPQRHASPARRVVEPARRGPGVCHGDRLVVGPGRRRAPQQRVVEGVRRALGRRGAVLPLPALGRRRGSRGRPACAGNRAVRRRRPCLASVCVVWMGSVAQDWRSLDARRGSAAGAH